MSKVQYIWLSLVTLVAVANTLHGLEEVPTTSSNDHEEKLCVLEEVPITSNGNSAAELGLAGMSIVNSYDNLELITL